MMPVVESAIILNEILLDGQLSIPTAYSLQEEALRTVLLYRCNIR